MEMTREYLNEPIVGIIAPAGYGKTEEIADAIVQCTGKQLVLTHTRAGVAALRERMKRKQVEADKYEIETIASFCMKWCKAYPKSSGYNVPEKVNEIDYHLLYSGTDLIFCNQWAQRVLQETYSGIFVDEYQDCVESQHSIFMKLNGVLPLRFFGDPMQGIFYWIKDDKIVNWSSFAFSMISPLSIPWRWEKTNKDLGNLLDNLRKKLLPSLEGNDVAVNLKNISNCMTIIDSKTWNNGLYAYRIKGYQSLVYITSFKNKQESFSQHNGGFFQCDEVKDLAETEAIITKIEAEHGEKKALILLETLKNMINGIQKELVSYLNNLSKGKLDFSRISKHEELGTLIKMICEEDSAEAVLQMLRWFGKSPDFKIYRTELFYRIGKTYSYMAEEKLSLRESIEALSNQQYFMEKSFMFPRMSSRTVLTKGLEFDSVIIDARDKMDVRDFYVAMTRAKRHVFIITDKMQLQFKGIQY